MNDEVNNLQEEIDRLYKALDLAKTMTEQDRTAFHHISDNLSDVRSRNTALRRHVGELVEENSRLRLALANAQHGDV